MKRSFYKDFPDLSKKEWLEKITSDLKGKSIHDLNRRLSEYWEISPFFTNEDLKEKTSAQSRYFSNCLIAQSFNVQDPDVKQLLNDALANGLQTPVFENVDSAITLKNVVNPEHWASITPVIKGVESSNYEDWNEVLSATQDTFIKTDEKNRPKFNRNIKYRAFELETKEAKEMPESLSNFIFSVVQLLDECEEKGAEDLLKTCWLEIEQGKRYYLEIARLRAIRILWSNLLQNYGFEEHFALPIIANVGDAVDQEDPYRNMISYTTAGIYAMIAGADIVNITPIGDQDDKLSEQSQRRISRNIQNIAQLESHLDMVEDPAAGSFAFEKLSRQLAQKSWQLFLEKTGSPAS